MKIFLQQLIGISQGLSAVYLYVTDLMIWSSKSGEWKESIVISTVVQGGLLNKKEDIINKNIKHQRLQDAVPL